MRSWSESEKKNRYPYAYVSPSVDPYWAVVRTNLDWSSWQFFTSQSGFLSLHLVGMSEVYSGHKPLETILKKSTVTSSSNDNAPTTKCRHSQLRKWRKFFPGWFLSRGTWPRMPRLRVWTRQHGKVCPDFRQETWRELCRCWWMWSSKTGRRISHLC